MKLSGPLFGAMFGICLAGAVISGYLLFDQAGAYLKARKSYEKLEAFVQVSENDAGRELPPGEPKRPGQTASFLAQEGEGEAEGFPQVDFKALEAVNGDIAGWLYGAGTGISYPVAAGADDTFYLDHLFDKSPNSSGCLFLQAGSPKDFSADNNIIYGHHMKDGTMFAHLVHYKEQAYYEEHPVFWLVTPEKAYRVRLFSGYVAQPLDNAWQRDFQSEEEFKAWLKAAEEKSCFKASAAPLAEDRIITFSTCSYEFEDARFVVHGILEPEEAGGS